MVPVRQRADCALVAALGARAVLTESRSSRRQVSGQGFDIVGLLLGSNGLVAVLLRTVLDRQRGVAYVSAFLAVGAMSGRFSA